MQKMSKSLDNYIGITDAPNDMFGKIISISDDLLWCYCDLLSFITKKEIEVIKQKGKAGSNPWDTKIDLAKALIACFHNKQDAESARQNFFNAFRKHDSR